MKRIIFCSTFCFLCILHIWAYSFNDSGFFYTISSTNTVYVTYNLGNDYSGYITIPKSVKYNYKDYLITAIGKNAFKNCLITSVSIPNSVITIDTMAFAGCSSLTGSLTIPNSVKTIGVTAFGGCSSLTGSLIIPTSVTTIGAYAFESCSGLTGGLVIPNSVTTIGANAFYRCSGLNGGLTIPNSVTMIGDYAFYSCSGLKGSLIIPNSVTTIGDYAFNGCSGLTGNLIIPNSVTTIGTGAFSDCIGFTGTLTLSNSIISIGAAVFSHCQGISGTLNIPKSLISIKEIAFVSLPTSGFVVDVNNLNYSSDNNGVLFDKSQTTLIAYPISSKITNYIIPTTVNKIGEYAFYESQIYPNSITIPSTVTSIGDYAFNNCYGLSSLYVNNPNTYNVLGYHVFERYGYTTIPCTLYVPIGYKSSFQSQLQWKDFANIKERATDVASINDDKIRIYPNPITESFRIGGIDGNADIRLTDINGRLLLSKSILNDEYISASSLPKGIYFVNLITNEGVIARKVLKN